MRGLAQAAACLVTASFIGVHALPQVTRTGRYLYTPDGARFYLKGVAYQEQGEVVASDDNPFLEPSTFVDPLALPDACTRDIPALQSLGVNSIRVYSVDSTLNHDSCMNALDAAGIYTIIDLALPLNGSIDRAQPAWSTNLLNQYTNTIDAFSKYPNVLAYNVGNENIVSNTTGVTPFIKAATRDVKSYLKSKSLSTLVGYAAINGASNFKVPVANYLSCDPTNSNNGDSAIDLYGLNDYEWCGDDTIATYQNTIGDFAGYNVAAYFSEYGCITNPPRLWTEVVALLGPQMSPAWSGGIAFAFLPAASIQGQFGMVTLSPDNKTVITSDDYDRLKAEYAQVTTIDSPTQASAGASTYPSCPTANTTFLASNSLPPTPNAPACGCLQSALSCQFTPASSDYRVVLGELTNVACSLLGEKGGSCSDIGANGTTGIYGRVSGCDPTIKLSYVMSQYFELNNRDPQACSFAGNGTVNTKASSTVGAAAVASSCISNPDAVFTPSSAPSGSTPNGNGGGGGSNNKGGGSGALGGREAFVGVGAMTVLFLMSVLWTLV